MHTYSCAGFRTGLLCRAFFCAVPALYRMEVSLTETNQTETPLDREPLHWTENPPLDREPLLWTETPRQRPSGQRPSWTETLLDRNPPGQRPPDRDLLDRDPLDRDPLDRDHCIETPWIETPWTGTLLDREPLPCGQTNTCENITFANFVCER